jgi:hypothetical protein
MTEPLKCLRCDPARYAPNVGGVATRSSLLNSRRYAETAGHEPSPWQA